MCVGLQPLLCYDIVLTFHEGVHATSGILYVTGQYMTYSGCHITDVDIGI